MNKAILNTDAQAFIKENLQADIRTISLKKSPFPLISPGELAEQIDSKRRCMYKLPLWFSTPEIYYPPKLAIEQSSSETAARYKSGLINGSDVIDLTGGFGVDSYFFSLKAQNVTHCELSKSLSGIANYNSRILGADINFHQGDGLEYLNSVGKVYGTVYIDPSRRVESKRVFMLKDCEPDIIGHLPLLRSHAELLIIKAAPFLDIQSTIAELEAVSSIHVISIKNECKELLFLIDQQNPSADPPITCALLSPEHKYYTFRPSEEKAFALSEYSPPLDFIYEPDVALLKAGCFKLITRDFNVYKLQQNTHLYTSNHFNEAFPGRRFKLRKTWLYGAFLKTRAFSKANVICRNFPLAPEVLKKKLKISDGGDDYLLFCTGPQKELLVLHCERV